MRRPWLKGMLAGACGLALLLAGAGSAQNTKVDFPINLNTATDEEILAIPGMGPRMLREFLEYRPYVNIEQFRREIGKYVSKEEVARFEQYVFVPTNPNTASEGQLLALKGVDKAMAAYIIAGRPFRDWAALKAALLKRYDAAQVVRLERYWVFR